MLQRSFYSRPALALAKDLLGKKLVHLHGGVRRTGRIVETEAYVGAHDLACHARFGPTPRASVLFGKPGHAYVYLIYGMYDCFNVVADREGVGAAVLVRALEPIEGIEAGHKTDGPGKLCRALHITRAHNRMDLTAGHLYLEDATPLSSRKIAQAPRVGVDYAGVWSAKPYRFWIEDNPFVSRERKKVR